MMKRETSILYTTVVAGLFSASALAGIDYTTLTIGPDTEGWFNEAGLTSTVAGGYLGGETSLAASGDGKNQFYVTGEALFGTASVTIDDIASIQYATNKSGGGGSPDWFVQIYTTPYAGSPGSSWYGNRIQAEPYLASNVNAPADQWNDWTTESGVTNSLNWGDSSNGDFGASLGSWDTLKSTSVLDGSGTYGDAGVLFFTFGTGSGWADGFDGQISPITVNFTDGTGTIINFVPSPPALAGLLGLGLAGRRRRR